MLTEEQIIRLWDGGTIRIAQLPDSIEVHRVFPDRIPAARTRDLNASLAPLPGGKTALILDAKMGWAWFGRENRRVLCVICDASASAGRMLETMVAALIDLEKEERCEERRLRREARRRRYYPPIPPPCPPPRRPCPPRRPPVPEPRYGIQPVPPVIRVPRRRRDDDHSIL